MKHVKLTSLICFASLIFCFSVPVSAGSFSVMTEEYPPFNHTENGRLTGLSSEVVIELLKRVGHENNIKVLPWARAYNLARNKAGKILFSMTRTEQREPLFKWVGPLATNNWVFFAKKGSSLNIRSLEDAKKVKKIGAYKEDAAELYLKEQGFSNIESVIDDMANVKKLVAGRIDLWIVGQLQGLYKAKTAIGSSAGLEKVFDVKSTRLYIAFSKTAPDAVVEKWQSELDKMKADGTYDAILKKYM